MGGNTKRPTNITSFENGSLNFIYKLMLNYK
jgi:hypothetical protein